MIVDTDVLIDFLRGLPQAPAVIKEQLASGSLAISVIRIAELEAVLRDGERSSLDAFIGLMQCFDVSEPVARTACAYVRRYGKSHGSLLPDALIAATADHHDGKLMTLNRKHYPMRDIELLIPYRKS